MNDYLPIIPIIFSEEIAKISGLLNKQDVDQKKLIDRLTSKEKPTVQSYENYHGDLQAVREILLGKPAKDGKPATQGKLHGNPDEARKINDIITDIENEIAVTLGLSEQERAARKINFYAQPAEKITLASAKKLSDIPTTASPPGTRISLPLHYRKPDKIPGNPLAQRNKNLTEGETQALVAASLLTGGVAAVAYGGYKLVKALARNIDEATDIKAINWDTPAMRANYWVEEDGSVKLTQYHDIKSSFSGQTAVLEYQSLKNLIQLYKKQGNTGPTDIPEFDANKFKLEGPYQDQMWTAMQLMAQEGLPVSTRMAQSLNSKQLAHLDKLIEMYKANESKEPDAVIKKGADDKPAMAAKPTAEKTGTVTIGKKDNEESEDLSSLEDGDSAAEESKEEEIGPHSPIKPG